MGSVRSRVMAALSYALLLASGLCVLAALWIPGPWWAWLGTAAVGIVFAAAFGTTADSLAEQDRDRWLLSGKACAHRSALNHLWVCQRPNHHDGPHSYVRVPR